MEKTEKKKRRPFILNVRLSAEEKDKLYEVLKARNFSPELSLSERMRKMIDRDWEMWCSKDNEIAMD